MSDLTERISAVLREVIRTELGLRTGDYFSSAVFDKAAAAVAEALQLTEETQFVPVARDGSRWAARSREEAYSIPNEPAFDVSNSWIVDHIKAERRWVSNWTVEQETP